MRIVSLLLLLAICQISFSQNLLRPDKSNIDIIGQTWLQTSSGEEITFSELMAKGRPVAVLFSFMGCPGCKLSLEETLIPNQEILEKEFDLKICIISKEGADKRQEAIDYYANYPYDLYFDEPCSLYRIMPPVPLADGRNLKAFPTLVIFKDDYSYVSVDPFTLESIVEGCRILENN